MSAHLLSLSALHAAAPGVLDIVFGADGDFEGAPRFTGPVRSPGGWLSVVSVNYPAQMTCIHLGIGGRVDRYMDELALDCRAPSIAARLAGLCARVLWPTQIIDGAAASVYRHGDWVHLAMPHGGMEATWRASGGFCGGAVDRGVRDVLALYPIEGQEFSPASLLASLTLSLAPRIAMLRSPA